jgi:predicted nucleic acid-binding Zn ribbon protein
LTHRPRPLAEVLPALRARLVPATPLADVQTRWADVVGERIAGEAEPVGGRDGVITVQCSSGVWAAELSLMSPQLIERLNADRPPDAPAITELRFKVAG